MFHIIDDEAFLCDIISDIIASLGYASKTFICPKAYIDYTKQTEYESPIAVISDVKMPAMSGFEMMDTILKNKPSLKFVLMSGYIPEEPQSTYRPYHFLHKPFEVENLIDILEPLMKEYETA